MNADLAQMVATISGIQADMAATRDRNRRDFPLTTAAMDSLRNPALLKDGLPPFEPRVVYAEENGRTIGKAS